MTATPQTTETSTRRPTLALAHVEGAQDYLSYRHANPVPLPETDQVTRHLANPYAARPRNRDAMLAWAWDLGWRLADSARGWKDRM